MNLRNPPKSDKAVNGTLYIMGVDELRALLLLRSMGRTRMMLYAGGPTVYLIRESVGTYNIKLSAFRDIIKHVYRPKRICKRHPVSLKTNL
jgi:hypothetical protein